MLRLRSSLSGAIHDFFRQEGFIQIHTPILTTNDCEGAGETFQIQSAPVQNVTAAEKASPEFFDAKTYLSVSSQLHLEAAVG